MYHPCHHKRLNYLRVCRPVLTLPDGQGRPLTQGTGRTVQEGREGRLSYRGQETEIPMEKTKTILGEPENKRHWYRIVP